MKKNISYKERLKSIKFTVFMLVWFPSVVFTALKIITGLEFVSLMTLIGSIFTVAHEHTKKIENGFGGVGNEKPPTD